MVRVKDKEPLYIRALFPENNNKTSAYPQQKWATINNPAAPVARVLRSRDRYPFQYRL
jgi:hypothetical protein